MVEMPRPQGSYGAPTMAMIKWASQQGGREFTARDLFRVFRQAGGMPNQGDDSKAYQSFQTIVRKFIDSRGKGSPEQPLVVVQAGVRGRGGAAIYRWGNVRNSQTPAVGAANQQAKANFADMDLGPAGAAQTLARQPQQAAPEEPADQEEPIEPDEDELEQEPEEEPEDQTEPESEEDQLDWIPEAGDPDEPGVPGAMGRLQEEAPEQLEELLTAMVDVKGTDDAGLKAIQIFGKGKARTRDAILVAKQCALNLGLPNNDND